MKHALNYHWCKNSSNCFRLCDVQSFNCQELCAQSISTSLQECRNLLKQKQSQSVYLPCNLAALHFALAINFIENVTSACMGHMYTTSASLIGLTSVNKIIPNSTDYFQDYHGLLT